MSDIVATWPNVKPLEDYLSELQRAVKFHFEINFRVARGPKQAPERCYMVHSGFVRGWNRVKGLEYREQGTVARMALDADAGFWPEGWYIVRDPVWHPVKPLEMRGFQGWRYFDREEAEDVHT